jgi:hypothetical protein
MVRRRINARAIAAFFIIGGMCWVAGACWDRGDTIVAPDSVRATPVPPPKDLPRRSISNIVPPGRWEYIIPFDVETATLSSTSSGCSFPDSSYVRITVVGSLTATLNANFTCCATGGVDTAAFVINRLGTWGPTGFQTPTDPSGAQVFVQVQFSSGSPTGQMDGYPHTRGDKADSVEFAKYGYFGKGTGTVFIKPIDWRR